MTTQTPKKLSPASPSTYGAAAFVCFSFSLLALAALHLLKRDYEVRSHMISDYAVGPYGWVMSSCFLAMSCGLLMLFLGLFRHGPTSVVARLGVFILLIPIIGLVVSGMFDTDLPGAPSTREGDIHGISFLMNVLAIMIGTVLISLSLGRDARWSAYGKTSLILVAFIFVAFVLQFLTLHKGMPYGYTNRFFVTALFAWFLSTSTQVRNVARLQGVTRH